MFARLIAARRGGGCADDRVHARPARHAEPSQQRRGRTALAIFNDRHPAACVAAHLSIVELRLVCDEDSDYASAKPAVARGVRKVANVARSALLRRFAHPGRTRVYF